MRGASSFLSALLLLCASGCRGTEGPDAAYRTFAAAARAGDSARVWALLSEGSRARLDAQAKDLAARLPGAPRSGRDLALGDLSAGAPRIAKVEVLRASADEAVLAVTVEGTAAGTAPAEVEMVREGTRWRVVVPAPKRSP